MDTIHAAVIREEDGAVVVDVRGQTCPGYLLAINRAMDGLEAATTARLLVDYPPSEGDVRTWCGHQGYWFEGVTPEEEGWALVVRKP